MKKSPSTPLKWIILGAIFTALLPPPAGGARPALTAAGPPGITNPPAAPAMPPMQRPPEPLVWLKNLELAMVDAAAQYRAVLVLVTTPQCVYCRRLKAEVLSDPRILELLGRFSLVEVDGSLQPEFIYQAGLTGVPAILILSPDGRERDRVLGMVQVDELAAVLRSALGLEPASRRTPSAGSPGAILDQETIREDQWAGLILAMADDDLREPVRMRLRQEQPFPKQALTALLSHPQLAARLGALEALEEIAGEDFGFDPWSDDASDPARKQALAAWKRWAGEQAAKSNVQYAALTRDQVQQYLRDLISEKRERYLRAMCMLERTGESALPVLEELRAAHPELPPAARARLKEMEYALQIPVRTGVDPAALAHRLVFGNLDAQLEALRDIARLGRRAVPILRDFLATGDPLLRETAAEMLIAVADLDALPLLGGAMTQEKDPDVLIVMLRCLGTTADAEALPLIKPWLGHANEDVVIAALQSLGKLDHRGVGPELAQALKDERWRVRATAAETAGKLKLNDLAKALKQQLDDPEPFVRYRAVQALAELEGKSAAGKLTELFIREDELKGPIVKAFGELELNIPQACIRALDNKEPAVLAAVLQELSESGERGLPLASRWIEHSDTDLACAAIRFVGEHGANKPELQKRLAVILRDGDRPRQLAVLESIQTRESSSSSGSSWSRWDWVDTVVSAMAVHEAPSLTDELNAVFMAGTSAAPTTAASSTAAPPATLQDLFADFQVGEPPVAGGITNGVKTSPPPPLVEQVRILFQGNDPELQRAAALALLRLRQTDSIAYLRNALPGMTEQERRQVAQDLQGNTRSEALPLLCELVRDSSAEVREAAAGCLKANLVSAEWADALFGEMVREGSPLKPAEILDWSLFYPAQSYPAQGHVRRWALDMLAPERTADLHTLGLVLLEYSGRRDDEALVASWLNDPDPWSRRAAAGALAMLAPQRFAEEAPRMAGDSFEYVREIIPLNFSRGSSEPLHYFAENEFVRGSSSSQRRSDLYLRVPREKRLAILDLLRNLTHDPSARVRLGAVLALISRRQPVEADVVLATIEAFPDQKTVGERVGKFLRDYYRELPPDYDILLPYLKSARVDSKVRREIKAHFSERAGITGQVQVVLRDAGRASKALETVAATGPVRVVFFEEHACADCAQAAEMLGELQRMFPDVRVETHEITRQAARQLYDCLAREFGMPQEYRMLTPAIFSGAGYLFRDEIAFDRLADLMVRSRAIPEDHWYHPPILDEPRDAAPSAPSLPRRQFVLPAAGSAIVLLGILLLLIRSRR